MQLKYKISWTSANVHVYVVKHLGGYLRAVGRQSFADHSSATKLKLHVGIPKKSGSERDELRSGLTRSQKSSIIERGIVDAFNCTSRRYDDLYSYLYTNVCGKRQRRGAKTIDKSIRSESASAQAEQCHVGKSFVLRPTRQFLFFSSLFPRL